MTIPLTDPFMATYLKQCDEFWVVKDDEGFGNALVLKTSWEDRFIEVLHTYKARIIRLNEYVGWPDADISFLLKIPTLHGVDILSDKVTDVSPIFEMKKLRTLSLYCKARIAGDFTAMKSLESVGLGWRNVYISIFGLTSLVRINVIGYPDKDLRRWECNLQLVELRLESNRLQTLDGIERFPHIKSLGLHACSNLGSFAGIGLASSIRELRISQCPKINDLSPMSQLSELRVLEIEDCHDIDSVVPISKCRKLERLQIAGNTTIMNGDLSSLQNLPNLKEVLLVQKKHYSHTDKELRHKRR